MEFRVKENEILNGSLYRKCMDAANAKIAQGQYEAAVRHYSEAKQFVKGESYNLIYQEYFAYSKAKNYKKSLEFGSKLIKLKPELIAGYIAVSYCLYKLERFRAAIEICQRGLRLPNSAKKNKQVLDRTRVKCEISLLKIGKTQADKNQDNNDIKKRNHRKDLQNGSFSNKFLGLPDEVLVGVFRFIDFKSTLICSHVCRKWRNRFINIPSIWNEFRTIIRKPSQIKDNDYFKTILTRANFNLDVLLFSCRLCSSDRSSHSKIVLYWKLIIETLTKIDRNGDKTIFLKELGMFSEVASEKCIKLSVLHGLKFPVLKKLIINANVSIQDLHDFLITCPRLELLKGKLVGDAFLDIKNTNLYLPNLRSCELELSGLLLRRINREVIQYLVKRMPNLENLRIDYLKYVGHSKLLNSFINEEDILLLKKEQNIKRLSLNKVDVFWNDFVSVSNSLETLYVNKCTYIPINKSVSNSLNFNNNDFSKLRVLKLEACNIPKINFGRYSERYNDEYCNDYEDNKNAHDYNDHNMNNVKVNDLEVLFLSTASFVIDRNDKETRCAAEYIFEKNYKTSASDIGKKFPKLRELYLRGHADIDDTLMCKLKGLDSLEMLDLQDSCVSGYGIENLLSNPRPRRLRQIVVKNCMITPETIEWVRNMGVDILFKG